MKDRQQARQSTLRRASTLQTDVRFGALAIFLLAMGIFSNSRDWFLDITFFAVIYSVLWILARKYPQTPSTITLLILLPTAHMAGALGAYHWSIGGVSWDVYAHIFAAFIGTLLLHAFFTTSKLRPAQRVLACIVIIVTAGIVVEIIEEAGGQELKRQGEGMFYRGAGDFCADTATCTAKTDTVKDMFDNVVGIVLGMIAISYVNAVQRSGAREAKR